MSGEESSAVAYVRRLYDNVLEWYRSADNKAQVVLGLDGAFLAFLAGAAFAKPDDLRVVVHGFTAVTWFLLAVMTVCLLGSIAAAIHCLQSRLLTRSQLAQLVSAEDRAVGNLRPYRPAQSWFFQILAPLDRERLERTLRNVDSAFEIEALSSQIHVLSQNVEQKHRAVNAGFLLAAITLTLFLLAGASYVAGILL